jgi:formate hydrogenlyase subunit 3/multisubunit Na+/H+ antiporter MnhD subunit
MNIYYIFNFFQSISDATQAVKEVGLSATLILIVLLFLITAFGLIVRWLMQRIDKKDEQLLSSMNARREDLMKLETALQQTASAVEKGTDNMKSVFENLAQEVRRK